MMKRNSTTCFGFITAVLGAFLFLADTAAAQGSIIVTEIMYDLPGADARREWVEVENRGVASVDLSTWKFLEGETRHGLTAVSGGATLQPGAIAVIADDAAEFLKEWPVFSGIIFDSSFSLSNSGEPLSFEDETGKVVYTIRYREVDGAGGDGLSLENRGGAWHATTPTPGRGGEKAVVESAGPASPAPADKETVAEKSGVSEGAPVSPSALPPPPPRLSGRVVGPLTSVVGAEVGFSPEVFGIKNEPITRARFLWNFGDGTAVEGQKVSHTYHFPGEYLVVLDVSSGELTMTARHPLTVLPAAVLITRSEPGVKGFVELTNTASGELDLSGWHLRSGAELFTFPYHTILLPGRSIRFPSTLTGLNDATEGTMALLYPNGVQVPMPEAIVKKPVEKGRSAATEHHETQRTPAVAPRTPPMAARSSRPASPVEELAAAVAADDVFGERAERRDAYRGGIAASIWVLGVVGLIAVGVGSVLLVLKGKEERPFTIVEEKE